MAFRPSAAELVVSKRILNPKRLPGPSLEDFADAQKTLTGVVQETPIEFSRYLSEVLGHPVHLKCENLQRTGAYKIRGAYYCISKLSEEEKAHGVVAASAGNHAQGVAFAAREQGIRATIFTPMGVALPKLQATQAYGAEVVLGGDSINEPLKAAQEFAERTGAVRIPPFDHPDIIAGQGTVGLEIMDQVPEVTTVIVPIGGGGLMAGVASAMKQRARAAGISIKVIGVQAENAASYPPSLKAGKPLQIDVKSTINDGIAVQKPGMLNFEIIKDAVDDIVTVSDDETARAMLVLLERAKLVVEPSGAVGVAAILEGKILATGPTVVVLSGGNIDPMIMERVISRGMAGAGRYMKMRIPLPDRPGQLARTSQIVSENNANVVEVIHTRHGNGLPISQVELELHVETRGPEHAEEVLSALRAEGYEPRVVF
jgi:threonine dehydratase